jgi:hypothetical protein
MYSQFTVIRNSRFPQPAKKLPAETANNHMVIGKKTHSGANQPAPTPERTPAKNVVVVLYSSTIVHFSTCITAIRPLFSTDTRTTTTTTIRIVGLEDYGNCCGTMGTLDNDNGAKSDNLVAHGPGHCLGSIGPVRGPMLGQVPLVARHGARHGL